MKYKNEIELTIWCKKCRAVFRSVDELIDEDICETLSCPNCDWDQFKFCKVLGEGDD